MVNLALGHPSLHLLPTKQLALAATTVLQRFAELEADDISMEDRHPLQYGTDQGPHIVRKIFAAWFDRMYDLNNPVDPDYLGVTCGASYALANTLLQYADINHTRRIFMITPAYFLAAKIFEDAGFGQKLFAIDEVDDGFSEEALRGVLENDALTPDGTPFMPGKRYRYFFYCVPTFSNPTGIVWSLQARQNLVALARQFDILICSDEVYDFLDYRDIVNPMATPLLRFVDIDRESCISQYGNTLSNMSFSKYLGPGLRCGVVQGGTRHFIQRWSAGGANHSGGNTSQMTSYLVAELVKTGEIDRILYRLREIYGARSRGMIDALRSNLPVDTTILPVEGGYFLWLKLGQQYDVGDIVARCKSDHDLTVLAGSQCEVPGDRRETCRSCIRLSLSSVELDKAIEAIKQLGKVIIHD